MATCNISATVTVTEQITATVTVGGKSFQQGTLTISPASTTIVFTLAVGRVLGAIIWVNGSPLDWELAGCTYTTATGTLDTTAYGSIGGTIRYEYK